MVESGLPRRDFVKAAAAGAAAGALVPAPAGAQATFPANRKMIGIQVGAVSFVDEGVTPALDMFQQAASVNTLFVATFTYGRGIAGRQVPGQPLPDHGKQEYDTATFKGGNFATPHPQYYKNTSIKPEKAPDHPGYDVIADVLPAAHRRK